MAILAFAIAKHHHCVEDLVEVCEVPVSVSWRVAIWQRVPVPIARLTGSVGIAAGGDSVVELELGIDLDCLGYGFLNGSVEYHMATWEDLEVP